MPPPSEMPLPISEIRLKLTKFANRMTVSSEALNQCKFSIWEDAIQDNLVLDFSQKIPTLEGEKVWVPATWWEHLKLRFFKGWLLRRYPVRYIVHEARLYLPDVPLPPEPCFEIRYAVLAPHFGTWTKDEEGLL